MTVKQRVKIARKSLYDTIEQIRDSIGEITFKGIEFTHLEITFAWGSSSPGAIIVELSSTALPSEQKQSRHFTMTGSDRHLADLFEMIEWWKQDLIDNHAQVLKQQQGKLFK